MPYPRRQRSSWTRIKSSKEMKIRATKNIQYFSLLYMLFDIYGIYLFTFQNTFDLSNKSHFFMASNSIEKPPDDCQPR